MSLAFDSRPLEIIVEEEQYGVAQNLAAELWTLKLKHLYGTAGVKKMSRGRHGNYARSKCAKVSQDIETTPKNRDKNYNQYTEKAHVELSYLNWNVVGSGARTFSVEGEGLKSRFAEVLDELARNESQQHALTCGPYDRLNVLSL